MWVVIEKNTYQGPDGDFMSTKYTVSNIFGPFMNPEDAQRYADFRTSKDEYAREFAVQVIMPPMF